MKNATTTVLVSDEGVVLLHIPEVRAFLLLQQGIDVLQISCRLNSYPVTDVTAVNWMWS